MFTFKDEDTEAQGSFITCLGPHGLVSGGAGAICSRASSHYVGLSLLPPPPTPGLAPR